MQKIKNSNKQTNEKVKNIKKQKKRENTLKQLDKKCKYERTMNAIL